MPYAATIRDLRQPIQSEQVGAVFSHGGFGDMRHVLPADESYLSRGEYPTLLMLGVAITARIYRSQRAALAHLQGDGLWTKVTETYRRRFGDHIHLPEVPPTARQQDRFVDYLTSHPNLLSKLSDLFTVSAIGQARALGNFPTGVKPDFANPYGRHAVLGDGTFYKRYSDVEEVVNEETGEITYKGSRSRSPRHRPRIQEETTNGGPDGKAGEGGINHVTLLTWTEFGWVVLANRQAFGGEIFAAREVIDSVQPLLGKDLHTVIWDRALTGHDVDRLMAKYRILVVGKAVARGDGKAKGYTPLTLSKNQALARLRQGEPLPLGNSLYETAKGHDIVYGKIRPIGVPTSIDCQHHRLWVDDGALVDTHYDQGHFWKHAHATAVTSDALPDLHTGLWTLRTTWRLPCGNAVGGAHEFSTTWRPQEKQSKTKRDDPQRALGQLRPVSRADSARFAAAYNKRNNTESYHAWLKGRLGNGGAEARAMRLSGNAQFLDHICVGMLANAITAWRKQVN